MSCEEEEYDPWFVCTRDMIFQWEEMRYAKRNVDDDAKKMIAERSAK